MSNSYVSSKYSEDQETEEAKQQAKITHTYKIILLGDIAVGKTSIVRRFVENEFSHQYFCTVGVEFKIKKVTLQNSHIANLKIWDTCGEEKFRALTRQYYHHAEAVVLVFDLTNKFTYSKLDSWIEDIKSNGPDNVVITLAGNKKDAVDSRDINENMIQGWLSDHPDIKYFEVSALNGEGVNEMFAYTAEVLFKKEEEKNTNEEEEEDTSGNAYTLGDPSMNGGVNPYKKCSC